MPLLGKHHLNVFDALLLEVDSLPGHKHNLAETVTKTPLGDDVVPAQARVSSQKRDETGRIPVHPSQVSGYLSQGLLVAQVFVYSCVD